MHHQHLYFHQQHGAMVSALSVKISCPGDSWGTSRNSKPDEGSCERLIVSGANMKRNLSQSRHPVMMPFWIALLAASLVAGPGFAEVASAVELPPTPTASPTGDASQTAAPAPTVPSTTPPPEKTSPAESQTARPSADATQSMAEAVGVGGAEMGQRSARVTASTPSESFRRLSTESLSSEGTWMPTFGVQGLDVSGHQPSVDWQQQWNMGSRFAYVKATEGNYYTNPSYSSQYQGSRNVGMIRGAYHFAIPNWSSGADQARFFVQNGGGWSADGYTMPPVLDFEFNPYEGKTINGFYFGNTCYNMSPAQLQSWVRDFGNTVRSMTGRLPVIYTNTSWWNQCLGNPPGFGDYPLWVAAYPNSPTNNAGPVPTASWSTYSIWQYSSTGPFAGDSNVWNGDYASLQQFAGAKLPTGSFDELAVSRGESSASLQIRGWSVDLANTPASNEAHIYVTGPDGRTIGYPWKANSDRPDVDRAYGYGSSHGFDGSVPISTSGTYKVCAFSIGAFGNTSLGCRLITATGIETAVGNFDYLDQVRGSQKVTLQLKGWAVDLANPSASTFADAYVTGPGGSTTGYRMTANLSRPDVNGVTGLGTNHGFDYQLNLTEAGTYKACVYAIGQNFNRFLSCKSIRVDSNPAPIGSYDSLSLSQGPNTASLNVRGWALDPSLPASSSSISVYFVSKDGSGGANPGKVFTANLKRPDVNSALATVGDHGFEASVPITAAGSYTLCAQAIGLAPLSEGPTLLGCKDITVGSTPPTMGNLDDASLQVTNGQASLVSRGWTLDPSFPASSIPVHVYVKYPDGSTKGYPFTANLSRQDVNNALQTIGTHGFVTTIPVTTRGQYNVCAYGVAVSVFSTNNSLLGCRTLTY
jgi:GH25 family lysozyme M1 (1,4-beta-N-acetylmuramidase)